MKKTQKNIENQYIDYILTHNKRPFTVYSFTKDKDYSEKEFYQFYSSFYAIEKAVWGEIASNTIKKTQSQEIYANYSAREKLLSFYYTLVEMLKDQRSFVIFTSKKDFCFSILGSRDVLSSFKEEFTAFIHDIIQEGISSGEIESRMFISDYYTNIFWYQLLILLKFWTDDHTPSFERTDAAIEKAVNLSFELIGPNLFDSLFDTGKFFLSR